MLMAKSNQSGLRCSFVTARGQLKNQVKYNKKGIFKFSVKNQSGTFYVRGQGIEGLDRLNPGDQLLVSGRLRSFYFKTCRRHHHYIEPLLVVPSSKAEVATQQLVELWKNVSTPRQSHACFPSQKGNS